MELIAVVLISNESKDIGYLYPFLGGYMGAIIVKNINKKYGKKVVLRDVSFEANNEVVFLAGFNGAGKTTFLRIALNLEKADSGEVEMSSEFNQDKVEVGAVFDKTTLYPQYSGRKNIKIMCMEYLKEKDRVEGILDDLALDKELLKNKVSHYSFGQTHRLMLAIALIRKPEILFLDEPTIGLDPLSWQLIEKRILKSKEEDKCCFIITGQDYNAMKEISDKILVLQDGKNLFWGSMDKFMSINSDANDLQQAFLNFVSKNNEIVT